MCTVDRKKKSVMSALFGVKCIEEDEDEEDELDAMVLKPAKTNNVIIYAILNYTVFVGV